MGLSGTWNITRLTILPTFWFYSYQSFSIGLVHCYLFLSQFYTIIYDNVRICYCHLRPLYRGLSLHEFAHGFITFIHIYFSQNIYLYHTLLTHSSIRDCAYTSIRLLVLDAYLLFTWWVYPLVSLICITYIYYIFTILIYIQFLHPYHIWAYMPYYYVHLHSTECYEVFC